MVSSVACMPGVTKSPSDSAFRMLNSKAPERVQAAAIYK